MAAAGKGKFTPARRAKFLEALKAGFTRAGAAGMVGIHRSIINYHCEQFPTFAAECATAEQEAEARMTAVVIRAARDDPKWAIEWLKRRRSAEWGETLTLTLLQKVLQQADQLSDEDLLSALGYGAGTPVG